MPPIVAGMDKLMEMLDRFDIIFTNQDLAAGAEVIIKKAQELCPVDTGYLRASAYIDDSQPYNVVMGFDAPYASYVEFGTYKMDAQPYLRPAIDEEEEAALQAIVDSIESHFQSDIANGSRGGGVNTQSNPTGGLQP